MIRRCAYLLLALSLWQAGAGGYIHAKAVLAQILIDDAWRRIRYEAAVQGNLDPVALFAPLPKLRARVEDVLRRAGDRPGFIFNLGHGILPETPVENVKAVVAMVREFSATAAAD